MEQSLFDSIFDKEILSELQTIEGNNSLIKLRNIDICKRDIYRNYSELNKYYKSAVFGNEEVDALLDRHKLASCVCGAFLRSPVFDEKEFYKRYIESGDKVEAIFFYSNEIAAFFAGYKFLKFFMIKDFEDDNDKCEIIKAHFPIMPPRTNNKVGVLNSILFNLHQIRKNNGIGINHYDIFAYAMNFFWLESYFYLDRELT